MVGYREVGGVYKRSLTRIKIATGSEVWQANDFGDAAVSHGGFETIDITPDGTAALISGWMKRQYTSDVSYRSGGNTAGGKAVVMKFLVAALTTTRAPTAVSASWTKEFPSHNVAHAARGLASGEVSVLKASAVGAKSEEPPSEGLTALLTRRLELWA